MGITEADADRQKAEVWGVKKLQVRSLFQGLGKEVAAPDRKRHSRHGTLSELHTDARIQCLTLASAFIHLVHRLSGNQT